MKIQLFAAIALLTSFTFAKEPAPDLKSVLQQIRKSPVVTFKVEKKTKSELLGSETTSPGTIYISNGKFRWDTDGKEKSRIIFDGKTVWTIQDPPEGFKVPPQVTKMKLDKKSEGQLLLKNLFNDKFDSHFKVAKKTKAQSQWVYNLAPLKKDSMFTDLEIRLSDKKELSEISYSDEVQNKIQVLIKKVAKDKKPKPQLFEYKPPAGAQVTEI